MNHHLDNSIYLGNKAVNLMFSLLEPFKMTIHRRFVSGSSNGRWQKELEHYRSLKTEEEPESISKQTSCPPSPLWNL